MGTLFSTLDVARSGLRVAQVQLDIAGHNIANVNTEGFSRQRVELAARFPHTFPFGQIGRGVEVQAIRRIRDEFLDRVYRVQVPGLGRSSVEAQFLQHIEDLFLEPGREGLGTRLNAFFDTLNDFANNVEALSARQAVLSGAQALADTLRQAADRLFLLRTGANEEVRNLLPEINGLASNIAALNLQIRASEANGTVASDQRDARDLHLDRLARLVNITHRERADGQVDVQIAGDALVDGGAFYELTAVRNAGLDPERNDLVEVRFAANNRLVDVRDGGVFGALTVRDTHLVRIDNRLDQIAATIIREINRIQSQGNGLQNLSGTITSRNLALDAATALTSAASGLPFTAVPGTFDVVVYDGSGTATRAAITITAATTLASLAADLSAIPNFSAAVSGGGRTLSLGTAGAFSFTFANDTSGVLAALNINGLFTGHDARTIGLNRDIVDNSALLSSGFDPDVRNTGDNSAARAMADVRNVRFLDGNSATLNEFYESIVASVGVDSRGARQERDIQESFTNGLDRRRQEVSGVSLDEEVTFMLQFQRAFEASARVITIVDRMLDALLGIAR